MAVGTAASIVFGCVAQESNGCLAKDVTITGTGSIEPIVTHENTANVSRECW